MVIEVGIEVVAIGRERVRGGGRVLVAHHVPFLFFFYSTNTQVFFIFPFLN